MDNDLQGFIARAARSRLSLCFFARNDIRCRFGEAHRVEIEAASFPSYGAVVIVIDSPAAYVGAYALSCYTKGIAKKCMSRQTGFVMNALHRPMSQI